MLQILSSLNLLNRIDAKGDAWIISGQTSGAKYPAVGTWVVPAAPATTGGDMTVGKPTTSGVFAFPIWSESSRDLKGSWSPDVLATGNVTVINGKLRAVTDQFVGTPTVGAALYVDANGQLTSVTQPSGVVVAYCTKASFSTTYLSKAFTAIEFVTV